MRRKLRQGLLLAAAVAIGLLAPQAGADIVIDSFNGVYHQAVADPQDPDNPTFAGSSVRSHLNILGGHRELYVESNLGGVVELRVRVGDELLEDGVAFSIQEPTSAPTAIFPDVAHITWDGTVGASSGGDPSLNLLTNLSANGQDSFLLRTNFLAPPGADRYAQIEVWDTLGNVGLGDVTLQNGLTEHLLSFADIGFTGVQFSSIGAIRLHFLTDDIRLLSFEAISIDGPNNPEPVPVPPAVALGALGMAAVAGARRRSLANLA